MKKLLILLLALHIAFAADNDLDGVDDSVDLCPNSSFDTIVNRYGCKKKIGVSIGLGGSFSVGSYGTTESYATQTSDLYLGYKKGSLRFSAALSYISSGTVNSSLIDINSTSSGVADTYLYGGYLFKLKADHSRTLLLQALLKLPTAASGLGSGVSDYGLNLNYATVLGKFSYYIQGGYLFLTDTSTANYNNILSTAVGAGVTLGKFYSSISYNYASPYIQGDQSSQSIGATASYSFSKNWSASLNYGYGLSDAVADQRLSLSATTSF